MKRIKDGENVLRRMLPWAFACGFVISGGASLVVIGISVLMTSGLFSANMPPMLFSGFYVLSNLTLVIAAGFGIASVVAPVVYLVRLRFREFGVSTVCLFCAMLFTLAILPLSGPLFMASGLMRERGHNWDAEDATIESSPHRMEFMIEKCIDGKIVCETNVFVNGKLEKPLD